MSPLISVMRPIIHAVHRDINLHLTSPQIQLLQFLDNEETLTVSEIAAKLEITLSGVSALARRMEKTHLIERKRSEQDRRVVRLAITEEGDALLGEMALARNRALQNQFSKLSADEVRELERLCRKMLDR